MATIETWVCCRCKAEIPVIAAPPDVDDFGAHFICPHCGLRNNLVNIGGGGEDDPIELHQVD